MLSIVVPTKDRYEQLKHLINLIDGFRLEEIELVIQDNNYNNNEILEFLSLKQRSYLKYYHNKEQLPVYLNADLAIHHSTGEYVCFIGDDDGVLPNIIDCVKWMKRNGIEALRPAITIYNWPDFLDFGKNNLSGALFYDNFSYDVEEIDINKSVQKLANRGFTHIYTIPKVYQGIVKRKFLDEIYKIGGTYSPGPSPDMATAVALSFVVKKFVVINLPVILIGQSQTVGGCERKLKGGVKNIDEVPFLPKNAKENWNSRIPKVWCSQTVWPESAIKAIQYMNKESEIKINYEFILAKFIRTHKSKKKLALQLSNNRANLFNYLVYFKIERIFLAIRWRMKYFVTRKRQFEGRNNINRGINDIERASDFFLKEFPDYTSIGAFNRLSF
jgi:glycosyltransferase involved in cell wall biosynthesis